MLVHLSERAAYTYIRSLMLKYLIERDDNKPKISLEIFKKKQRQSYIHATSKATVPKIAHHATTPLSVDHFI